jgi:hypothetical protein
MPQTLKLSIENGKESLFYEEKSLVGLTPGEGLSKLLFTFRRGPFK